jgi:hypothetical protein
MPIHDWTRVDAGLFHAFRFGWVSALCDALNCGSLPFDHYALAEPSNPRAVPDGLAEAEVYAHITDRIAVHQVDGPTVAVIEIVSPGNKTSNVALRAFVERESGLIKRGINLLVIDLLPPAEWDPLGIYNVLGSDSADFELVAEKPLVLAAYEAGPEWAAYVEPVAVGDVLPDMPLFLWPGYYVLTPLEATYQTTWNAFPAPLKGLLEDKAPNPSEEP